MEFRVNLPCIRRRAERDNIVGTSTSEGAGLIIISITISVWAGILEQLRVRRGLAGVGRTICAAATVLVLPERLARALTRYARSISGARHLQLRRALFV